MSSRSPAEKKQPTRPFKLLRGSVGDRETSPRMGMVHPDIFVTIKDKNQGKPQAHVMISGFATTAAFDSGADISAIDKRILYKLRNLKDSQIKNVNTPIKLANEISMFSSQLITVPLDIAGRIYFHEFFVVENLSHRVILGNDFLKLAGIVPISARDGYTFNDLLPDDLHIRPYDTGMHPSCQLFTLSKSTNLDLSPKQEKCFQQGDIRDDLTLEQKHDLKATLLPYYDTITDQRIGHTTIYEHVIETIPGKTVNMRAYHAKPPRQEIIDEHMERLLREKVIQKCPDYVEWGSPICLPLKADGTFRFTVDMRQVNLLTISQPYMIPRIQDSLDLLKDMSWFSTIDMNNGFHQVSIHPDSREKTAFVTGSKKYPGKYMFNRVNFGAKNSSSAFQKTMDRVLEGLNGVICFIYVDDVLIFSRSFEEHLKHIKLVLDRLKAHNLTVNPSKSIFCKRSIKFLGHKISENGVEMDYDKVKAMLEYPQPRSPESLATFLGMVSWYTKFLPDLATIAKPLNDIKETKQSKKEIENNKNKKRKFMWSEECQAAFVEIKRRLTEAPVLAFPSWEHDFSLEVDASDVGIAACLFQYIDNVPKVIAYSSKTLNKAEQNYHTGKKEALACVWGVEKFRDYLELRPFTLITDHQALMYLYKKENPKGQHIRWITRLQGYDFKIEYRKGELNTVPDALSRAPLPPDPSEPYAKSLMMMTVNDQVLAGERTGPEWALYSNQELKEEQKKEGIYNDLIKYAEEENSRWLLHEEVMYYKTKDGNKPYIPKSLRETVLQECHDLAQAGHMGISKSLQRVKSIGYWPKMTGQVARYVRSCKICQLTKSSNQKPAGLMVSKSNHGVLDQLAIDFVGQLPRSSNRFEYILVLTDRYSRWSEFHPVRKATAKSVCKVLESFFARTGAACSVLSDNATQFRSKLVRDVLRKWNVKQTFTTPFHPQANPAERVNRNLKAMLRAYCREDHTRWDRNLDLLCFALNSAQNEATGYSPAELFLGRQMRSPIVNKYRIHGTTHETYEKAQEEAQERLNKIHEFVKSHELKRKEVQAKNYNKGRRDVTYNPGQLVVVRTHPISSAEKKFAAKLGDLWAGPYKVLEMFNKVDLKLQDTRNKSKIISRHVMEVQPFVERSKQELGGGGVTRRPTTDTQARTVEDHAPDLAPVQDQAVNIDEEPSLSDPPLIDLVEPEDQNVLICLENSLEDAASEDDEILSCSSAGSSQNGHQTRRQLRNRVSMRRPERYQAGFG